MRISKEFRMRRRVVKEFDREKEKIYLFLKKSKFPVEK